MNRIVVNFRNTDRLKVLLARLQVLIADHDVLLLFVVQFRSKQTATQTGYSLHLAESNFSAQTP
jgi:hypothetical protein